MDIQFAPFFLSQMLEYHMSSLYSSLDELVSLDPELYKSISYIKVRLSCSTFSILFSDSENRVL